MGNRPVVVDPNPIFTTASQISSILKDRDLYQLGAVSYRSDTIKEEYAMLYQSYRAYHISHIYTIIHIPHLIV